MFNSGKSQSPFFSKKFLEALLELERKQEEIDLYTGSLETLLLKIEENTLVSVGDRNYVDYRSISDNKRNIVSILKEEEYNKIFVDSVQFEAVQSLKENLIKSNLTINLTPRDISVYIELPKTYEDYLDNLGKKKRHELNRKLNKFTKEFSEYEILKGNSKDQFTSFIELHKNISVIIAVTAPIAGSCASPKAVLGVSVGVDTGCVSISINIFFCCPSLDK